MVYSQYAFYNQYRRQVMNSKANANRFRYAMSGFPILGDIIRADDWNKYWNDYARNYGVDVWGSAKYPSLMVGAGNLGRSVGSAAFGAGFVSSNLYRLYQNGRGYGYAKHGPDPAIG